MCLEKLVCTVGNMRPTFLAVFGRLDAQFVIDKDVTVSFGITVSDVSHCHREHFETTGPAAKK